MSEKESLEVQISNLRFFIVGAQQEHAPSSTIEDMQRKLKALIAEYEALR